jgi:hypothetical protein
MYEQTQNLFEISKKADIKFDYFMCSVAGALFAYIAQTYTPQKLDNFFSVFQTVSLLLLAASFYCGIRRIQIINSVLRFNYDVALNTDNAGNITKVLRESKIGQGESFRHATTGEPIDRQKLETQRSQLLEKIQKIQGLVQKERKKGGQHGRIQVNFLILGFAIILLSKVLQPYQSDFSHHPNAIGQTTNTQTQSLAGSQTSKPAQP